MTRARVEPLPRWRVEEFLELPSTQTFLRERLQAGADVHGLVARAERQASGRGRGDKTWTSPPGGSYQSLALQDRWHGALRDPQLTLRLGVRLATELREAGAAASVKWPNDVYLGEGKLGGVLCEYVSGHLLVGVGVNVANQVPPNGAALVGWELTYVNELVLEAIRTAVAELLSDAAEPYDLPARFAPVDFLAGRSVTVRAGKRSVEGTAQGLASNGALLVTTTTRTVGVTDGTVLSWSAAARTA